MWVGQAEHGWAGSKGIQRIVFTGKTPMDIQNMNLTNKGFDLAFTQPVSDDSSMSTANYKFKRYNYEYHKQYGSKQINVKEIPVTGVRISTDGKTVSLDLENLDPGYVYELTLGNIKSRTGDSVQNKLICYTLNRLKE